jgi:hypothetical protein
MPLLTDTVHRPLKMTNVGIQAQNFQTQPMNILLPRLKDRLMAFCHRQAEKFV